MSFTGSYTEEEPDLRYKKCLIKTMVQHAKELSSTHQAFVDECRHPKSMIHRSSSLVNCIIDKCDYSSTLDARTKSHETLRVSILSKDQVSVNIVKREIITIRSNLNTKSDSLRAKLFVTRAFQRKRPS